MEESTQLFHFLEDTMKALLFVIMAAALSVVFWNAYMNYSSSLRLVAVGVFFLAYLGIWYLRIKAAGKDKQ